MKKLRKYLIGLLVFTMILAQSPAVLATGFADSKGAELSAEELDRAIGDYIEERAEGTVALSLGVYKDGEVIYKKHYGYIDVENQIEANDKSIYEWGSVSKALIWVSVMQLCEAGKLQLDADVRAYFSDDINRRLKYEKPVSMRQLMNHQAGFQEVVYPVEFADAEDIIDFEELLIASEPAQIYEPGTVTAYNNWSAALAAYVVESVSGMPFYRYVNENIFSKLGMKETSVKPDWSDNPFVQENRRNSKTYSYTANSKESFGSAIVYIGLYPAGACAGTLDDFLKFAAEFTNPETKLFKNQETLSEMKQATSFYSNSEERNHHGLWSLDCAAHLIGHSGNTQGFTSTFFFDPKTNVGYAVMTNEVGESAYNYGLAELIFGKFKGELQEGEDISGIYFSKRTIEKGCARMIKYLSMILPISKTEENGVFKLSIDPDTTFSYYGNNIYRQDNHNGLAYNIVKVSGKDYLESYVSDMGKIPHYELALVVFCLLGMVTTVLSVVPTAIIYIRKRVLKKEISRAQKINYLAQFTAIGISLIFFYTWMFIPDYAPKRIIPLCVSSSAFALLLLVNFTYQIYNKAKQTNKTYDLVKSVFLLVPVLSVLFFQMYNFWA